MASGKTNSKSARHSNNGESIHTEKKLIAEAVRTALVVLENIRSAKRLKPS